MSSNVTTDAKIDDQTEPTAAIALAAAFTLGSALLAFIFFRLLCRLSNLPKSLQPQDPTPIYTRLGLQVLCLHN